MGGRGRRDVEVRWVTWGAGVWVTVGVWEFRVQVFLATGRTSLCICRELLGVVRAINERGGLERRGGCWDGSRIRWRWRWSREWVQQF